CFHKSTTSRKVRPDLITSGILRGTLQVSGAAITDSEGHASGLASSESSSQKVTECLVLILLNSNMDSSFNKIKVIVRVRPFLEEENKSDREINKLMKVSEATSEVE